LVPEYSCKEQSVKEHAEEWKQLCEQASVEQDPNKLLDLIRKINELLAAKRKRLSGKADSPEKV
jgi:hypothetical protein